MTIVASLNPENSREFPCGEAEFHQIATLARSKIGLDLPPAKLSLVYARLSPRIRQLGLNDFASYIRYLQSSQNANEWSFFTSALTTNVTQFFREKHHFDYLGSHVVPHLRQKIENGDPIRVWSAGCSSGQEAFSIAITLLEAHPTVAQANVQILATDIDGDILTIAATGSYPSSEIETLPMLLQQKYFQSAPKNIHNQRPIPALRNLITFGHLNLLGNWPMQHQFDVIFCRNVAIYFDQETRSDLWHRFSNVMTPNAFLFIGHSERLDERALQTFKSVSITTYQKTNRVAIK